MYWSKRPKSGKGKHKKNCDCLKCFRKDSGKWRKFKTEKKKDIDYFDYIQSSMWIERKQRYYSSHKRQCAACRSLKNIELHHMKYGNFGKEKDEHLVCLCDICHDLFHKERKTKYDMVNETKQFIETRQKAIKRAVNAFELLTLKSP